MKHSDSDKEKIRIVFEEVYAANVKSENLVGYGEMYTEDALWMAPNVGDRVGIPDIIEGFSQQIAASKIDPVFTAEEIEVIGDFGYVVGISVATVSPKDGGSSKQVKFRALWLMKKEHHDWKISHQIWNNKPL